jgi:bifunctional non-homologous end joining protein LigD
LGLNRWRVHHPSRVHPSPISLCSRSATQRRRLHEPKWDGFRFQIIKDGGKVRFYSRHGAEYTDRLPGIVKAFAKLPTSTAILDGELCLIDPGVLLVFTG